VPFFDQVMKVISVFDEANGIFRSIFEDEEEIQAQPVYDDEELQRQLEEELQRRLDEEFKRQRAHVPPPPPPQPPEPYAILGVTEDAPDFIVKAAYKAAAKRYHADKGGEGKMMSRLNRAFQEIKRIRGW
jgi:DnaJ-domain-containing protein 1